MKLIWKSLWARRRRNAWLLAELVLVSVVCWVVFDPVIVMTYDRRMIPLGYDAHRLCMVSLAKLEPSSLGYEAAAEDSARLVDDYLNLVRMAADFEGVERTAPVLGFVYPNSMGTMQTGYAPEGDSLPCGMMGNSFLPHTGFFETYGFQPGPGRTLAELSDYPYGPDDLVISEETALLCFGTKHGQGRRFYEQHKRKDAAGQVYVDTNYLSVVGTVGNFKQRSYARPVPMMFEPILSIDVSDIPTDARILIRLKEGVSMEHFLHDFRPWMVSRLKAGNLYARGVQSYEELIAAGERAISDPIYYRNLSLAFFFLINLCLGVLGTFWLQTRTRREEVGIMLSFGATPRRIVCQLMGEGMLLTFCASTVGSLLYLSYAWNEGFSNGTSESYLDTASTYWMNDFAWHFGVVSVVILLILWAVVLLGIYLPARSISRVPPTEALRDE